MAKAFPVKAIINVLCLFSLERKNYAHADWAPLFRIRWSGRESLRAPPDGTSRPLGKVYGHAEVMGMGKISCIYRN